MCDAGLLASPFCGPILEFFPIVLHCFKYRNPSFEFWNSSFEFRCILRCFEQRNSNY